jgi:hypothetical protein
MSEKRREKVVSAETVETVEVLLVLAWERC